MELGRGSRENRQAASTQALRVAVVEPAAEGGLAHFIDEYCSALSRAGVEVTLFTSSRFEFAGLQRDFEVDVGMELWPAHEVRGIPASGLRRRANRVRRALRRVPRAIRLSSQLWKSSGRALDGGCDVVQLTRSQIVPINPFIRARARRRGATVVELVHEVSDRERRGGVALGRVLWRLGNFVGPTDGYVVLSEGVRDVLVDRQGIAPSRVCVVPFGTAPIAEVDTELAAEYRRRFDLDRRPLVFCFGSIRPSKGIDVLIEAVARVPDAVEMVVLIAGHPTSTVDPGDLLRQVEHLGISHRVRFDLRYLDRAEVASLLDVTALVALPYLSATQSATLHHANAQGVPVLASRVGALEDDVRDGVDGRLVPPGDPSALAQAMTELLAHPEQLASMGQAARDRLERSSSWDLTAAAVNDAYHSWRRQSDRSTGP